MADERFFSLGRYLKMTFGERIHKISVYIGGQTSLEKTNNMRYCICNCSMRADAIDASYSLLPRDQIREAKERNRRRFKSGKFIVYFNTIPGTIVTLDSLKPVIEEAIQDNDVIGLVVNVHRDLFSEEAIRFFKKVSEYIYLWVEAGIFTAHEETRQRLGILNDFKSVQDFIQGLECYGVQTAPHVVIGLPGETAEMMRKTMDEVARLHTSGINFHHFCVLKGTVMEEPLAKKEIKLLEQGEYVGLACDFIEKLSPEAVLHRIVGEGHRERLIGPEWTLNKRDTLDMISAELEKRDSRQGSKMHGAAESAAVPSP